METAAAGQAVGSLVVPAAEAGKGIFKMLKKKYSYVKNLSDNFSKLEKGKSDLVTKAEDIKTMTQRNEETMERTRECETRLNEVEKKIVEFETLKKDYEDTSKCLCGLCPFPGLLKLGKRIVRMTRDVVVLENQLDKMNKMVIKAPRPSASPVPFIWKHAKKLDDFPSLNKHVEKLLEWLRDDTLMRIRIWGPPGVGKTTIMKNLHDRVGESHQFDIIFWVTVTTEDGIKDIQQTLWKQLQLKVDEKFSSDQIAEMISKELKDKSYVLFLDEVSSEINLEEAGIHDKQGRVVFACRDKSTWCRADEDINVQRMSDDDAEKLFWEIAGARRKNNTHIMQVAGHIIKECGGMPHMVKLIASSLADEDDSAIWRDTLSELRSPRMEPMQGLDEVHKSFQVVYDKLRRDRKPCLLYWAIFPAGCEMYRDYVIECWRAEELLTPLTKLGEARDRGHSILCEFVKKSLLEEGKKVGHFKMFEYFQRAALRIANVEGSHRLLVIEGKEIEDEEWKHASRISMISPQVSTLPDRPQCCGISTLLLQESSLIEFPRSFFGYMCGLRVLNLHETTISSLPSSISSLENLKMLFLNDCIRLVQLPTEIGDLHKLEILDIRNTGIQSLPTEIAELAKLKCLRVSFKEDVGSHNHVEAESTEIESEKKKESMEMIPPNIVDRLSSLEELSIYVNPNSSRWNQNADAVTCEVAMLEKLTTLCFNFPRVACLKTFIDKSKSWKRNNTPRGSDFRSFRIDVGYHQRNCSPEFDIFGLSAEKHLRFAAGEGCPDAISQVLKQACAFNLIGHQDATDLTCFGADNLRSLEACVVADCNEMESIIKDDVTGVFALKKLHIENLQKLVHIWKVSIESEGLTSLTTLTLKGCHSVDMLFSQTLVQKLSELQYLQVEDCGMIQNIVGPGTVSTVNSVEFRKLKNLQLHKLPRLSCICQCVSLECPSLETISVKTCEELKNLPSAMEKATQLKLIECSEDWWNCQVWPNPSVKDRFRSLHRFI